MTLLVDKKVGNGGFSKAIWAITLRDYSTTRKTFLWVLVFFSRWVMTSAQRGKRYWKVKEQNEAERESNWFRSQHKARYKLAMLSERVFFSRVDWDPKIHKSCFQLMVGFSFPSQSARSHALRFLRLVGNRPKKRTSGGPARAAALF